MHTIEEMITVMQHFANGGDVEARPHHEGVWYKTKTPSWDWVNYRFRIAKTKKVGWVCVGAQPAAAVNRRHCSSIYYNKNDLISQNYEESRIVKLEWEE